MKKIFLLFFFLPSILKAQSNTLLGSLETGTSAGLTGEIAASIGFSTYENSTISVGYLYKRLLNNKVMHNINYNGFRFHAQVQLFDFGGAYLQYDFVKGTRYMYYEPRSLTVPELTTKFYGEPVFGFFYNGGYEKALGLYAGVTPFTYQPRQWELYQQTPHKSVNFVFKIKYTLKTKIQF
ncbi:hypothetical protein [Pedobacter boryungensis]|uniref:Outer membrane protein beta-barrel domain-containing protein n=1 Tax=Pedobacter boryungensis TaxID=869962 RepID=A0ABX2DE64_9SPHI|nr:hypothetical protein [Pedobacter boryungensis]NQX31581.1 hypothetical protein [Pedobacter boryungensis]